MGNARRRTVGTALVLVFGGVFLLFSSVEAGGNEVQRISGAASSESAVTKEQREGAARGAKSKASSTARKPGEGVADGTVLGPGVRGSHVTDLLEGSPLEARLARARGYRNGLRTLRNEIEVKAGIVQRLIDNCDAPAGGMDEEGIVHEAMPDWRRSGSSMDDDLGVAASLPNTLPLCAAMGGYPYPPNSSRCESLAPNSRTAMSNLDSCLDCMISTRDGMGSLQDTLHDACQAGALSTGTREDARRALERSLEQAAQTKDRFDRYYTDLERFAEQYRRCPSPLDPIQAPRPAK